MSDYFSLSCYVYILKCGDGSYYVGHTTNLENRMNNHTRGVESGYTAARLPVSLVYTKKFETRDEAFRFERQLKGWSRKKKEALIQDDIEQIKWLASRAAS